MISNLFPRSEESRRMSFILPCFSATDTPGLLHLECIVPSSPARKGAFCTIIGTAFFCLCFLIVSHMTLSTEPEGYKDFVIRNDILMSYCPGFYYWNLCLSEYVV